ncbi:unnamed protein product [Chrysoparadoxa australica]
MLSVQFTHRVHITSSHHLGYPYLLLEGSSVAGTLQAEYYSGSGTDTIVFQYLIQEGDASEAFDYLNTATWKRQKFSTALEKPPGALIQASSTSPTTDALLFLPLPGEAGSVSSEAAIVIDTTRPFVISVSVDNPDGVYSTGDVLVFTVLFSQPVSIIGQHAAPSLELDIEGGTERRALYVSGSGTTSLKLEYTVGEEDFTPLLDYKSTESLVMYSSWRENMEFSDARLTRTALYPTQDADLTLGRPGPPETAEGIRLSIVGSGDNIAINSHGMKAESVTSPMADFSYPEGSVITIVVTFSVSVRVVAVDIAAVMPTLEIGLTGARATAEATYHSGSGTNQLTFLYTVQAGDASADLDYSSRAALSAPFGGIVSDAEGTPIYLASLPEPGTRGSLSYSKDIVIDTNALLVSAVTTSTPDGVYGLGEEIDIWVRFIFPVVLIADATATLAVNSLGGGVTAPFNRYEPDDNAVVFRYSVAAGHATDLLDYTDNAAFSNQVMVDASYAALQLDVVLPEPGPDSIGSLSSAHSIAISTTAPTVTRVYTDMRDGTFTPGASILIAVEFSSAVVFAPPDLPTNAKLTLDVDGTAEAEALYEDGDGTETLRFRYTVSAGDGSSDLDYASTTALTAAGLRRVSTVPTTVADLTLPPKGTLGSLGYGHNLVIDSHALLVIGVSSTHSDGIFGVGESILITVEFSGEVTVTGTPHLRLNSGPTAEAAYVSGSGTAFLLFEYNVGDGDSSPALDYADELAFKLGDAVIASFLHPNERPMDLLLASPGEAGSVSAESTIVVDTSAPTVTSVTSSSQNAEFGAGEEIVITVTFTAPCHVTADEAILVLDTGSVTGSYKCPYVSGHGTNDISFLYTVQPGDFSADLSYVDRDSLVGTGLLRLSDSPHQLMDLTLPAAGEPGSLSSNKDIAIDTSPPVPVSVTSLRKGTFTVGQAVDLHVTYDKAVTVTGTPRVSFAFDDGSIGYAVYDPAFEFTSYTLPGRSLPFTYTIAENDEVLHMKHATKESLELNGATIRRTSTNPITDAFTLLPSPVLGGSHDLVYKAELVVQGLYHSDATDLEVTLIHEERRCTVSGGASRPITLGIPTTRSFVEPNLAGEVEKPSLQHRALGSDYAFADAIGENVARHEESLTRQSSVLFEGASRRAVDGITDGRFSQGGVVQTGFELEPWWEVRLPETREIGFLRLFGLEEEQPIVEEQVVTIRSATPIAGTYQLKITFPDGGEVKVTDAIDSQAVGSVPEEAGTSNGKSGVGDSMESKLQQLGLSVEVERSDAVSTNVYQRSYTIRFLFPLGDMPSISLEREDLISFGNEFTFSTLKDGVVPGGVFYEGVTHEIPSGHANGWLMLLPDSTEDGRMTLDEAKGASVWKIYLGRDSPIESSYNLPTGTNGQVLRLQLEGEGYLSFAELQVYEMQFRTMQDYGGMSPIPAKAEWEPIQSSRSLTEAFQGADKAGTWVLQLTDATARSLQEHASRGVNRYAGGNGGVSSWTLIITDYFGQAQRYMMGVYATIETLPKYGSLHVAQGGRELKPVPGFERHLGTCWKGGTDSVERCPDNFGVGSNLSTRRLGAVSEVYHVRNSEEGGLRVWYQPHEGYLGLDDFSYSVTVEGVKSTTAAQAVVATRNCRLFEEGERHPLCSCMDPVIESDPLLLAACFEDVQAVCASDGLGFGTERESPRVRLTSRMKTRMCKSCSITHHSGVSAAPASYTDLTVECRAEIQKAGKHLVQQGYCESTYSFPLCELELSNDAQAREGPGNCPISLPLYPTTSQSCPQMLTLFAAQLSPRQ